MDSRVSSLAFTKSHRLLNAGDFQAVFNDAPVRAPHAHLLILSRPNTRNHPRLGLVIGKKNVRLATSRNQIKRLLRETFRLRQQELAGLDIVILARRGLDQLDKKNQHKLFDKQWSRLIKKAGDLQPPARSGNTA
ncbi:ribonuclease P protein component [Pseudomaricurvus alcaniphilus]|nr:ribonuclease P protein component [Pseudomaricurvus alcaniphilus]